MGNKMDTGTCTLPVKNPRIEPIPTRRNVLEKVAAAIIREASEALNMFKKRNIPMIIRENLHGPVFFHTSRIVFHLEFPKQRARIRLAATPITRNISGRTLGNMVINEECMRGAIKITINGIRSPFNLKSEL